MIVVTVFVAYALLLIAEAAMTYRKTGTKPSLVAGLLSGALVLLAAVLILLEIPIGASIGLGVMLAMMGVFGSRYMRTRAFLPAGIMMTLSLLGLGVLFRLMK